MAAKTLHKKLSSAVAPADLEQQLRRSLFVIPSVNGGSLLRRMFPTLDIPFETVVVLDQGSTDETSDICSEFGAELKQLGVPHTYTECCNIGLDLARERGAEFLFISNNDIRFSTDVSRELLFEMLSDEFLGIVSCSQLVIDEKGGNRVLSNRVFWDLSIPVFQHDLSPISGQIYRLESDFCELTCSLIRVSAAVEVGGFDNAYGFYHEDVDFGFRLREAGYTAAYLPQSQIEHFSGSTFSQGPSERRLNYISRSRDVFTRKYLGLGVRYVDHKSNVMSSWNIINKNLYPYIVRNGLLDGTRPELVFSHPGERPFDYLYSVWETSRLPERWRGFAGSYRGVFLPSQWNLEVFRAEGFANTHYVPLGVETDKFNMWGPVNRWYDEPTYLWFARDQYRKGLDVMMRAWLAFSRSHPDARLVVMGYGIRESDFFDVTRARRWQNFLVYDNAEHSISFREIVDPITDDELAQIYRSVDCVVSTSRSEGFGFSVVEAMACGTLCVFPEYGATADMVHDGALCFDGRPVDADYSDKGFGDVGQWWEPNLESIVSAMTTAYDMDAASKRLQARRAYNVVSGKFTWRNTSFHLRKAIAGDQERRNLDWTRMAQQGPDPSEPRRSVREVLAEPMTPPAFSKLLGSQTDLDFSSESVEEIFGSFDQSYYFGLYSDIQSGINFPLWHFVMHGCLEGRRPSRDFSTVQYVLANRDVRAFLGVFHRFLDSPYRGRIMRSFAQWEERNLFRSTEVKVVQRDEDFIRLCFQVLLRRLPEEAALDGYLKVAKSGPLGRIAVIEGIATSTERRSLTLDP